MLFSIVVPVHNSEKYLSECLESVGSQSFSDFELIVADDGSEDNSGFVADEYAARHVNTYVLHGVNQGPFLARRDGLRRCSGDYVVFLDSDDALSSDALNRIARAIEETGSDIISFGFSRSKDYSTRDDVSFIASGIYEDCDYRIFKRAICSGCSNSLWGKAIRLCCIDLDADCAAFEGSMLAEDLLQLLPIVDSSKSFVRIEDVLYYYRPNDAGSTANFREKYIGNTEQVAASLLEYGRRWGMSEDALLGVSKLYIGLSKILADSVKNTLCVAEARRELTRIRSSFLSLCPNAAEGMCGLRVDQRMLLGAVIADDLSRLRLVVFMSHLGRRLIGHSI